MNLDCLIKPFFIDNIYEANHMNILPISVDDEGIYIQKIRKQQTIFALAIDGHSISEIHDILYKKESTTRNQRSLG